MLEPIKKHASGKTFFSELAVGMAIGYLIIKELEPAQPQLYFYQKTSYITCMLTTLPGIYLYQGKNFIIEYIGSLIGEFSTTTLGLTITFSINLIFYS